MVKSEFAVVSLADPFPSGAAQSWAAVQGIDIAGQPAAAAEGTEIVLMCVPGAALTDSALAVQGSATAGAVIVDLTTADPESKAQSARAAVAAGLRYVDAAITGAVGLTGARTPLLVAGPRYADVDALFAAVGAPVQYLPDSQPGDAVRVKLLRSVVTKGIEALAVEVLPAARRFGLLDQLFAAMGDIDERPFTELLTAMVSSHPAQAKRRCVETTSAADQLEAGGYPATLTEHVGRAFAHTAALVADVGVPEAATFSATLDWLDRSQYRSTATVDMQEVRA
ncbi:hypothetical protein ASD37_00185 [Mycobacterium sp. Root135]|nr:hypothetical protein ASD37_00185 [Mycobacterium sp. Root135]